MRQRMRRSEVNETLSGGKKKQNGEKKEVTDMDEGRLKIGSKSLWMSSGTSTIPQTINRHCTHYSLERGKKSENGKADRDPQRDVSSLGLCPAASALLGML